MEGHGDLRPGHICLLQPPVIYDCLEFNREFRLLDRLDELAFLSVECERMGAGWVGEPVIKGYLEQSGDRPVYRLIQFYKCLRACLRAKLSVWHRRDGGALDEDRWFNRAQQYLRQAEEYVAFDSASREWP